MRTTRTMKFEKMTRKQQAALRALMNSPTQGNWLALLNAFGQYSAGAAFQKDFRPRGPDQLSSFR